jgi:hypothetical protein
MIPGSSNLGAVKNHDTMVPESKRKRKVSFYSSVLARMVPAVADYSPEEIRSIWYDRSDYKMFANMAKYDLINQQKSGKSTCLRGLEKFSEMGRETRRRRRLSSLSAVLCSPREEDNGSSIRKSSVAGVDVIAMRYMLVSGPCHLEAQFVGLCDEAAARSAFNENIPLSSLDDRAGTNHNKFLVLSKTNSVRSSRPISCSVRSSHWGPRQELQTQNNFNVWTEPVPIGASVLDYDPAIQGERVALPEC